MITILKILLIAYTISRFEPLYNWFNKIKKKFLSDSPIVTLLNAATCFKCLSLWIGFIMGGMYIGMIASLLAFIYEKNFSKWERKLCY